MLIFSTYCVRYYTRTSKDLLSSIYDLDENVLKTMVSQLEIFNKTTLSGKTLFNYTGSEKAIISIKNAVDEVESILKS